VNYTAYDLCHDQDVINPQTNCDMMVLSPDRKNDSNSFWYAHILGVFHLDAMYL
ncbi:hypothetical protein SERLA73DRAFT_26360, partial [Serpula lacrymans var. lacrymans S7.3]